MNIPHSFAAIDFETANDHLSSICSIGIVIVENGEITNRIYELVYPEPEYYSYRNSQIHGLTAEDTKDALIFPYVWKNISPQIEGLPLVAHFSQFDESCLRAAFRLYSMDYPDYLFYCTCKLARKAFPQLINHKLPTVALHCGYELKNHHHALADAEACARIAISLLK